ncbi:MAG TPA: dihydropteroate synthase [Geminicoccaceae bacterium]|nr:dihydropteroate synthase [Geminicoccaceae bacterium]
MKSYLRPAALDTGGDAVGLTAAGRAVPLFGGRCACSLVETIEWARGRPRRSTWAAAVEVEWPRAFTAAPPAPFDRPRLMGILNVTSDSFSDGGDHLDAAAAVEHGLRLAAEGADIVDVGGESTRPGARPVPVAEELRRVLPVVERLAAGVTVSIDTRKAEVMRAAVAAGARFINDVSGLTHDPGSLETAAASGAFVVLMHMAGEPATMNEAPPRYEQCALEVFDWLEARVAACEAAGIARDRLVVDPGLCFGKHEPENLDLLRHLALFHGLGCPVMLGASRKGWTEAIETGWTPKERLPATLAATQWALGQGVQLFRVHDAAAHRQLLTAWQALADPCTGGTSAGAAA